MDREYGGRLTTDTISRFRYQTLDRVGGTMWCEIYALCRGVKGRCVNACRVWGGDVGIEGGNSERERGAEAREREGTSVRLRQFEGFDDGGQTGGDKLVESGSYVVSESSLPVQLGNNAEGARRRRREREMRLLGSEVHTWEPGLPPYVRRIDTMITCTSHATVGCYPGCAPRPLRLRSFRQSFLL
jgi:hypothetical protein